MEMSHNEMLAMLSIAGMFFAFCFGFPISYTMVITGLIFGYLGFGKIVFNLLTVQFYQVMSDPVLSAIPFFLLMGYILEGAGLMDRLFKAFQQSVARLPGSLYAAIVLTGTVFAAATGIVGSSVNLLCIMSEPVMRQSNYNIRMGAGAIAAAGTLGILIPPSIMLVVLGPILGVSIIDLFAAAIIPGLLLSGLYIVYSLVKCAIWPHFGPPLPIADRTGNFLHVLKEILYGAIPLMVLIVCTLGSILGGIASPTEASACGAFGAFLLVAFYRRLTFKDVKKSLFSTITMSSMILILLASCNFFGAVFSRLGGATYFSNWLLSLNVAPMTMIFIIMTIIFFMGWAMEWIPIVLILVPLLIPVVDAMGYDKIWFALVVAVTLQTSWLSPPVALSAYFIKGALPHWDIMDIFKGMYQYIGCQIIGLLLILYIPEIVTWLPSVLR